MKREEKRMERIDGKEARDYDFITGQRIGLADGARANVIRNAADVREVTGPLNGPRDSEGTVLTKCHNVHHQQCSSLTFS
jgi:hypothetical protein